MPATNAFTCKDIISRIVIHANVQEIWIDSLAAVSRIVQKRHNGTIIEFSEDSAVVEQDGILKLCAFVAGERVYMEVPDEYWQWKPP